MKARLAITAMSAADFYRRRFPAFLAPEPSSFELDGPCVYKDEDVWSLAPFWIDDAFLASESGIAHVLTRSAAERGNARRIRPHVWAGELPAGSFFQYNADVAIATPGFTFLQLATELSFVELVAYGDELCGLYSLTADEASGYRARRVPLCTTETLAAFLQGAEGMRGYRQAMRAMPFIVDGLPTPADTAAEMLACLSFHRGGYCMPAPHANHHARLSQRASLLMGCDAVDIGICWPEHKACIVLQGFSECATDFKLSEPPSRGVSSSREEAPETESDRMRKAALGFSGYEVVAVSREDMGELFSFEDRMIELAKLLGKRIPGKKRGPIPAREQLRKTLFAWMASCGHCG